MKAQETFDAMEALVFGRASVEDTARALGIDPSSAGARKLETYRHTYVQGLVHGADILFPMTRRLVVAAASEARWVDLVTAFGAAHPPREIRFGAAGLPTFLAGCTPLARGLPPWTWELADLELWERRVYHAPDARPRCAVHAYAPDEPCHGACLLVTRPLALRAYAFDVLPVRRASDPAAVTPHAHDTLMAIWRRDDGERRTKPLFALPERLLRAVDAQGTPAAQALLEGGAYARGRVATVLDHFLALGLLARPAGPTAVDPASASTGA